ncbi:response regulator [uncultured Desulfobacter sp.]|uniref:response regulator n=1 Tax=uncultured Desulfobacter sp. TaxID=240139 RepID=UPI0029F46CC5|nr:response regulator [uncultured Desulfobacter sp.]
MNLFRIRKFYPNSLRWKLITGAAIIHAVLMSLFIWDLVVRQKDVLFERQQEHAHALSQTLAVTCAHWLISYDIAGLQELINAQRIYPELSFALITDIDNKVLAHTEPDKIGKRIVDMPEYAKNETLYASDQMVDVAVPVSLAGTHIGWVRIGINNQASNKKLKGIASDGILYALCAVLIGAVISWFLGTKLTSRLHTIQQTVRQIRAKGHFSRIDLSGNDEAALVAHEFNRMFARLQRNQQELKNLNEDLEFLVDERTEELQKSFDAIKQKNMELTETKEELEKARKLAILGVWEFDIITDKLTWSDEIYTIFELDKTTFKPSYEAFLKIVHPDDRDKVRTTYENALRTGEKYQMTHRIVTGQDRIKWVEEHGRAEFDDTGKLMLAIGTIYDISMQKEAEEKLKEAMTEIKKTNLAKSVFLSNMSHELRTPLNAILGYSQIFAEDRTLNEKQQSGIKTIRDAGDHLLMLINDILDLSKIEAGKLELFVQHIVFKRFLQSLCDIVRNRCAQKTIMFRYEPDKHLPDIIIADEVRLRQILLNLLSNAAKFTDNGYCLFAVKAESLADQKTMLTFIVEDSGPGIAEEQQADAFEPFKQLGERLKYAEGTGLGLSISLQLATLMNGTLSLISPVHRDDVAEYGPGSRFVFTAVVETCPMEATEKYIEPDAVYRLDGFEPGTRTILIVDDRPTNRAVLKDTLEPLGFLTTEASDGKEVPAACEQQRPDLILMDLVMPGVDGFTALRELKKMDRYAQIPVVAVTASLINKTSLKQRCEKVGFKGFLPKPFAKQDLLKILADLLNLALNQDHLAKPVDEQIVPPPSEILEQLQNHLADGNIDAIELMAADIAEMDSGVYRSFAKRLSQLAAEIQIKGIEQFIEQFYKK